MSGFEVGFTGPRGGGARQNTKTSAVFSTPPTHSRMFTITSSSGPPRPPFQAFCLALIQMSFF